ncbi:pyridoxal-dependent decarboxylase [Neohortaea acidophila]|uniref:Ornithine decarboxylase n=1 Tax=Neohortaea acidophila TaxID=245834 RepID=A0A6A6PLV5_9PEZI|nr:pyridoxal-dependent decarboxylase [Neohortaea acidophila]KAF2481019.1 pyridoxal-dependent decarboxylase [Neohortaea acidophila]
MAKSVGHDYNEEFDYLSLKTNHPLSEALDTHGDGESLAKVGSAPARELIGAALNKRVQGVDPHDCEAGAEDAFFVADLGEVYRQHVRWTKHLKRVTPHFAVKCNPDPMVIRLLAALGTGFDCASKAEIEQVLSLGVHPSRIIYAQPCKTTSYLRYTAKQNVTQMTFDNSDELYKIKQIFPHAELYLRIFTDDSASMCRLSQKFGARMENTKQLLTLAKTLGLNVAGVAFHVGSGASDPEAFLRAVRDARAVFDQAAELGFNLHTLDVGGGFCSETFEDMAAVLGRALDDYFPPHIRIIAEPGRYYTSSAFTIACNVIARRTVEDPEAGSKSYMLYLNDGVYGNFSSIMFDHQHPVPQVLSTKRKPDGYKYCTDLAIEYSIWGPTCDGIDCIAPKWTSAETLDIGDWLYFEDMGAYTKCSATRFNGFTDQHDTIYVSSEPGTMEVVGM